MKIDFEHLEETVFLNFNGGNKELLGKLYKDSGIKIMRGHLKDGATVGYHKHETSSEIIYILGGSGKVLYDDTEEKLCAGSCHYCPKGHSHSLQSEKGGYLDFFAVVPEVGE